MAETTYAEVNQAAFLHRKQESGARFTGDWKDTWKPTIGAAGNAKRHKIRVMPPHKNMIITLPDGAKGHDPIVEVAMHFFPSRTEVGKDGRPVPIVVACFADKR